MNSEMIRRISVAKVRLMIIAHTAYVDEMAVALSQPCSSAIQALELMRQRILDLFYEPNVNTAVRDSVLAEAADLCESVEVASSKIGQRE
ncbi:hypothetical protein [Marinobacterium sp. BA1]|uniref:hypothetical protein n=1 Tax=Marinobacterium sp. BA1 TaxID=3138931 RepID=UPI0034E88018